MKKFLISTMLGVAIFTSAFASDANDISNKARYNFKQSFKNVDEVTWNLKSGLNAASFIDHGVFTEVFYEYDGTLVATCKSVTLQELPEAAQKKINKKFADYTVTEVISYDDEKKFYHFVSLKNDTDRIILKVSGDNVTIFKRD